MGPKDFTLYCDEAGNSGTNYLDPHQPVHVVAGWLVPARAEPALISSLSELRDKNEGRELHGVKLMKTRQGVKLAIDVLEACLKIGCFPVSLVAFKDHALSLRAVECFLDPVWNPAAEWLPSGANETRRKIATLIWQLAPDAVRAFGGMYKEPDPVTWAVPVRKISAQLADAARLHAEGTLLTRVASSLREAVTEPTLTEIIEREKECSSWGHGKRHESMSLNFPVFLNLLRNTDPIIEARRGRCRVVHDETLQFQTAMAQGVSLFRRVGKLDVPSEDGSASRLSAGSFHSFTTGKSKESLPLQAADILASSVFRVAKKSRGGTPLPSHEQPLAALAMGHELPMAITGALPQVPGIGSDDDIVNLHRFVYEATTEYYKTKALL
jgi:hypothetical protein